MPIDEEKQASSLVIDTTQISLAEMQNRFGVKHDVIRDVTPGKVITILAVETDAEVQGDAYKILETYLKETFGVNAMQTVFVAMTPENDNNDQQYNIYISGHLRIEDKNDPAFIST